MNKLFTFVFKLPINLLTYSFNTLLFILIIQTKIFHFKIFCYRKMFLFFLLTFFVNSVLNKHLKRALERFLLQLNIILFQPPLALQIFNFFNSFQPPDPPIIEEFSFAPNLKEGRRTQLTCMVTSGDFPITIHWLKDGHHLSHDISVEQKQISDYSVVRKVIFSLLNQIKTNVMGV